jgi:hypothetical protein
MCRKDKGGKDVPNTALVETKAKGRYGEADEA